MRIPEFLKSTYIMLFKTFPDGICEEYYLMFVNTLFTLWLYGRWEFSISYVILYR